MEIIAYFRICCSYGPFYHGLTTLFNTIQFISKSLLSVCCFIHLSLISLYCRLCCWRRERKKKWCKLKIAQTFKIICPFFLSFYDSFFFLSSFRLLFSVCFFPLLNLHYPVLFHLCIHFISACIRFERSKIKKKCIWNNVLGVFTKFGDTVEFTE